MPRFAFRLRKRLWRERLAGKILRPTRVAKAISDTAAGKGYRRGVGWSGKHLANARRAIVREMSDLSPTAVYKDDERAHWRSGSICTFSRSQGHSRHFDPASLTAVYPDKQTFLVPVGMSRAHPVEVFGRRDGLDIAFVFDGKWRRLPDDAYKHAATEVSGALRRLFQRKIMHRGPRFSWRLCGNMGGGLSHPRPRSIQC